MLVGWVKDVEAWLNTKFKRPYMNTEKAKKT